MKVRFLQSGGFVGTVKGCELDTAALSPETAQELERLVEDSQISVSGEFRSDTARDLHQYEITIEKGDCNVSVVLDDANIPQSAKPLLGFLKKRAHPKTIN